MTKAPPIRPLKNGSRPDPESSTTPSNVLAVAVVTAVVTTVILELMSR